LGIESVSGISPAATEAAAVAVRESYDTTLGLAVTGEPRGGGSLPGKLIVAVASPAGSEHREFDFPIEADRFRRLAAYVSFAMLRQTILPT
jgi:nicotinamide mononucleotide (NMN) deamidase PncC